MQERLEKDPAKEELRGEARDARRQQLRDARQRIAAAYDRTRGAASRWYEDAVSYGREYPAMSALLAFGAGLGVGALLFADRRPPYRRRVVPAVAAAIADVVREVFDTRS